VGSGNGGVWCLIKDVKFVLQYWQAVTITKCLLIERAGTLSSLNRKFKQKRSLRHRQWALRAGVCRSTSVQ
jgi:hypothetical protein